MFGKFLYQYFDYLFKKLNSLVKLHSYLCKKILLFCKKKYSEILDSISLFFFVNNFRYTISLKNFLKNERVTLEKLI